MERPREFIAGMLLDSDVVVRVEIASVTVSLRDWAELRVGDVLETAVLLKEPVVVRIAGREVARGELVSVDGNVGVRLTEIHDPA